MSVTKVANFKPGNLVYEKTESGETPQGTTFYWHKFKYKHEGKDGGSSKGTAKFKGDFLISYPSGLYFAKNDEDNEDEEISEKKKEKKKGKKKADEKKKPKLMGGGILDWTDPKIRAFADAPHHGAKFGWVKDNKRIKEAEGFMQFEIVKDTPYYSEASDDEENKLGIIEKGTIVKATEKGDGFFSITFGGGSEGMMYLLKKQVAKLLWKNKERSGSKRWKSEQKLTDAIKFPIKFEDSKGNSYGDKPRWYTKISYREKGKDRNGKPIEGFMASFTAPGVGDMTLEEMMSHSIVGLPCFSFLSLYESGDTLSMQIYLSSLVVKDIQEIEYTSAQQDDIDEFSQDPELVANLAAKLGPRKKKEEKKEKKKEKKEDSDEGDSDEDSGDKNIKSFLKPQIKKVQSDDEDSDESEDEMVKGISKKKGKSKKEDSDEEEEEEVKPKKKKKVLPPESDEEEEEEEKPKKKKKVPPPESDEEDEEEEKPKKKKKVPPPESDEEEEEEEEKPKKKKKVPPPESDEEEEEED